MMEQNQRLADFNHLISHNLGNQVGSSNYLVKELSQLSTLGEKELLMLDLLESSEKLVETSKALRQLLAITEASRMVPYNRFFLGDLISLWKVV